jgi:alpha-galactosidase
MVSESIRWADDAVDLVLEVSDAAPVRVGTLRARTARTARTAGPAVPAPARLQPLVEVLLLGEGHALSNTRFTDSAVGARLRYVEHDERVVDGWRDLRIRQRDADTGLEVVSVLRAAVGVAAVRSWSEITNHGTEARVLQMVTSFALGSLLEPGEDILDVALMRARSEWCGESRWTTIPLRGTDGLPDINTALLDHGGRGSLATVSRSTWSSGEYLPTGLLVNQRTDRSWAWQIEHNGAWHWEIDSGREGVNALALLLTGPNDSDHQWSIRLQPGEVFATVPVTVAVSDDGFEAALGVLTAHRRAIRGHRGADVSSPLIFNDYMNTLMGDPTTDALLPLIDAAAAVGSEYFCIDAGWYDDSGHWWDSVGEWQPSTGRFPDGGLDRVLDRIRERGMLPGLWLEPEVIGVRSPMADKLPDEAFLQRYGQRVVDHSRFQLDLRHPAAREHLDSVVDRLVGDHGIRYFKLDYNVTPGPGTDLDTLSAGSGLLDHNRAHLSWLDGVLERHPDVIFENCGSGAMRMDYAMLSRFHLQSTSDQQDFRLYPAISSAAPASVLPEQAGNWAYPQPGMPPEHLAFALVNGMLGRLYLSGHLDGMTSDELTLVREAVRVHKDIRTDIARTTPFWPTGLPGWFDDVITLGLRSDGGTDPNYLAVWSRSADTKPLEFDLPFLRGQRRVVETLYPRTLPDWHPIWDPAAARLTVTPAAGGPTARVFRLTRSPADQPES